jgi:hypothetical protein
VTYTQQEIASRIKRTLPGRWFGDTTPVLDSLLNALSAGWIGLFDLVSYTIMQSRIATAIDVWLDLSSRDFFGYRLLRRQRETDTSFRTRIVSELLRDRCTRTALSDLLRDLTGQMPQIFEPTNPQDTGCYGSLVPPVGGTSAFNTTGGWGSLAMPFQTLVRTSRPATPGIAMVNGWGGSIGGFGMGLSAYISLEMNASEPTDTEICREVTRTAPAGSIVWISIAP